MIGGDIISRPADTMLLAADLQTYLHEHIPVSKSMDVRVVSIAEATVVLGAPLAPNINHHRTVFGGSASALAILAAWSLLHVRCRAASIDALLVIQRNSMEYEQPIHRDFTASAHVDPDAWQRFMRMLARKGRARIALQSVLESEGRTVGRLAGEFVALNAKA